MSLEDDDGGYKLGDDALDVLRDLKRWIRFYDEKTNRMDVARCLAEANIVGFDLLQILATWPPNATETTPQARRMRMARIALACFEVMVPLTWPIEKDRETMTVNHHRHLPVLQLAQVAYKRAIINFDAIPILNTAVRVALPSMALPIGERTPRDQGIIKLILFFLRNIAAITPPPGIKYEGDETQISRSATIDAFSYQDIFLTLLTIASNMGEDFRTEDVIVMEIIFHIVKRVDQSKLFISEKQVNKAKADELAAAMNKEAAMLRAHNKNAPTRHSRFGTMIWVKRENGKMATVTGQEALLDAKTRERKMDSSKTFKPPRRARKEDMEPKDLGPPVSLDERARLQLRSFVEDFLDSGFNPLFGHVRKSLEREAPHVLQEHKSQFFYLVAWFLEAERMRRKAKKDKKDTTPEEVSSFNLVAEVLSQEMFITLNRNMDRAYSDKDWPLLTAVMRCYTQIFLTVQEMSDSGHEEDQEIADNTLSRLFYEETTHDLIANIVRTYKDQGFEYLDACTELTHTFLRILEAYSKQNVDLQVRSRKRARRKKKAAKAASGENPEEGEDDADDSANDEQNAEKTSQERKFDFKRFANRFIPQGVVDTFVTFTKFYRDLTDEQLKRAHRYFYRVAFKQEMAVMLFRLDIIHLFYNMIKGPEPLDKSSCSMYRDWEELAKQVIRKCVRKLEERPALFTELLFSKINSTAHYLEYGHEKQTISATNPRPAAELEFKNSETERDKQIAVAVGALIDRSESDHIAWVRGLLEEAIKERQAWEDAETALAAAITAPAPGEGSGEAAPSAEGENNSAVIPTIEKKEAPPITARPDTKERRTAMFKNSYLRLLMKVVGMERLAPTLDETPDSTWILPGTLTADMLRDALDSIKKYEFEPLTFEDGEKSAADQLKKKYASSAAPSTRRKRAAFDDDEDDGLNGFLGDEDDEDGILFPMGGPTARKATHKPPPKKRRRRREKGSDEELSEPDDEELAAKARARRQRELEKARKIKSEMYVHASDDETDDEKDREFFEKERKRQLAKNATFGLDLGVGKEKRGDGAEKTEWDALLGVDEEEEDSDERGETQTKKEDPKPKPKKANGKKRVAAFADSSDEEEEEAEETGSGGDGDSDASAPPARRARQSKTAKKAPAKGKGKAAGRKKATVEISDDDEDEDQMDVDKDADADADADADGDVDMDDTPSASKPVEATAGDDDEDDDAVPVAAAKARPRVRARAGFVMDSSDEE